MPARSSRGSTERARAWTSSASALTASTDSMRPVAMVASPIRFGPDRLTRTDRTSRTPPTLRIAPRRSSSAPAGARSIRMSPDRHVNMPAARTMITATINAAAASAHKRPMRTPMSPISTPRLASTSARRSTESASMASLAMASPTAPSTRPYPPRTRRRLRLNPARRAPVAFRVSSRVHFKGTFGAPWNDFQCESAGGLPQFRRRREQLVLGAQRDHQVPVVKAYVPRRIDVHRAVAFAHGKHLGGVGRQEAGFLERLSLCFGPRDDDHLLDADPRLAVMQRVEHVHHRGPYRQLRHPVSGHEVGRDRPRRARELQAPDRLGTAGAGDDVEVRVERPSGEHDVDGTLVGIDRGYQTSGAVDPRLF